MKTSNKILLISGSSLIGMVIAFLLIFRLTLGNSITTERPKDSDKPTVSRELPLAGFTASLNHNTTGEDRNPWYK